MKFLCLGGWKCREIQLHQDLLKFYVDICSKKKFEVGAYARVSCGCLTVCL